MSAASKKPAPDAVDPALVPFFDAVAELLVAQEERLDEARRALRAATRSLPAGRRSATKGANSGRRP